MTRQHRLNSRDAVVLLACVGLALMALGAVGEGGRRRTREFVCQSNLGRWGDLFENYVQQNDGRFYTGIGSSGFAWIGQMEERYRSPKQNTLWFCPEATEPLFDEREAPTNRSNVFSAWGHIMSWTWSNLGKDGICGSYGLNGYALNTPPGTLFEGGHNTANNWGTPDVQGAAGIPLFVDALRFDLWPLVQDLPPQAEDTAWDAQFQNHMLRCCVNRHDGAVDCLFMDWSVRKVGLKELWTLKWHRAYNPAGPWTKAGGVRPEDWPEWMRQIRDW